VSTPFPERLGRYELLLPIATGGMATVYLARARGVAGFEREVAVKLMHPHLRADPADGAATELVEEAKLAARIRHPNVVAVLDVGDDPHGIFLVMDYVEGETLSSLLRSAAQSDVPLPPPIALRILGDVFAGLHAAHELTTESGRPAAIVHRDFSPQNILVGTDGVARLTDFGIAKAATRAGHTQTGFVKGKVGYMAPEQARGRPLDRRCDVWAAGVVAWEVFAGRRLYTPGVEAVATVLQIISERAPALSSVRAETPAALTRAIASALEPDVDARCPSADELRRRIFEAWGSIRPAEHAEVAAHVSRLAAPRLRQWELRIQEILALRARMDRLVESVAAGSATPSAMPLPVAVEVDAMRAEIDALLDPSVTLPRSEAPMPPASSRLEDPPTRRDAPVLPRRRPTMPFVVGGAVIVAGGAALVLAATQSPAPPPAAPPADPTTAAAEVPSAPPASTRAAQIALSADAPIAQVRVGERVIAIASPSRSVTIELLTGEQPEQIALEIVAVDGRRVALEPPRLRSGVDDAASGPVEVSFAGTGTSGKAAARAQRPVRGGKPAPEHSGTTLLPSPYEKK